MLLLGATVKSKKNKTNLYYLLKLKITFIKLKQMKTLKTLTALILISTSVLSQTRQKEISFLYGGINENQLIFKKQSKKKENKFRRLTFSNLQSYDLDIVNNYLTTNFNIGIGFEKREDLAVKNLKFYRGPEFVTGISVFKDFRSNSIPHVFLSEQFRYNLGFSYTYKHFTLAVENQASVTVYTFWGSPFDIDTKIFSPFLSLSYRY